MDEVTNFLYKYVINNNPNLYPEDIDSYEALNNHDLLITYRNGNKEIFDTLANTSHKVNRIDNLTEEKMRLDFKRRLQNMMNDRWVNQEELAERINTTQQMISRYLTGKSIPNAITLKKIAMALDCDVDDFYEQYF